MSALGAYIIHIEGLQATLAKRNARIAELEHQLKEAKAGALQTEMAKAAYRKGWKACAEHLQGAARKMAYELTEIDKTAFKVWLEGEQK
jgi:hypothetical protein